MKIEDIKPGDVLVRTVDGVVNKVAKVTPDGRILRSAYTDMENKFCICLKPNYSPYSVEYFEPATEEQRRYINSKLFAFFDNPHAEENERLTILASLMSDLKKEKDELAERVKQLMDDYNRVVKKLQELDRNGEMAKSLEKIKQLELSNDSLLKECTNLQKCNEELHQKYDTAQDELYKLEDERNIVEVRYNNLREVNDFAEKHIARFRHSVFLRMEHDCPYGVKAKVGSLVCFNCEHYIKSDFGNTKTTLCAHNYDKEKQQ